MKILAVLLGGKRCLPKQNTDLKHQCLSGHINQQQHLPEKPKAIHRFTYPNHINWNLDRRLQNKVVKAYFHSFALNSYCVGIFFFNWLFIFLRFIFRDGKGEKHPCLRYTTLINCLSLTPNWGTGPITLHVPWLGIEPVTFWFSGQHSVHRAIPARAKSRQYLGRRGQCLMPGSEYFKNSSGSNSWKLLL